MTDDLKQCREAFEKWHDSHFDRSAASEFWSGFGYPRNATIQTRWQSWQAAWNTRTTPTPQADIQERARRLFCDIVDNDLDNAPDAKSIELIAQALHQAKREGMEEAAEVLCDAERVLGDIQAHYKSALCQIETLELMRGDIDMSATSVIERHKCKTTCNAAILRIEHCLKAIRAKMEGK